MVGPLVAVDKNKMEMRRSSPAEWRAEMWQRPVVSALLEF
jgi:hypothetical protein